MQHPVSPPSEQPAVDEIISVFRTLHRTSRRLRRGLSALFEGYGLTGAQYAILTRIPPGGITLTQLAETAWLDPGNTSGIVERLVREGWVNRTRSEEDRRVVIITLSEKGQRTLAEIEPKYRAAVAELMAGLSSEEVREFGRLLDKINRHLDTKSAPAFGV